MEIKKNRKADLESKRGIFFQLGLILTLLAVFTAFEYRTYEPSGIDDEFRMFDNTPDEIIPITIHKPKPPPPPPVIVIKPVVDETESIEDIFFDAGADETTVVENFNPDMPEDIGVKDDPIVSVPEIKPEFPGGVAGLYNYIRENINYPRLAKEIGIQGTVYVGFVVEKDGSISNVEILRPVGGGCSEEAFRVVQNMPKWKPGMQMGRPVRVSFNMPIKFTLK